MTLIELAESCEQADGADRGINRQVALAVGWHRYTPSELGRSNPGWIAPEDFAGETVGKDGRKRPVLDSLHGTDIWREPRDYLGSLDAAMQLVPADRRVALVQEPSGKWQCAMLTLGNDERDQCIVEHIKDAATAVAAAALRARHAMEGGNG